MIKCRLSRILGDRRMHILDLKKLSKVSYMTLSNLYHEKSTRIDFNTIEAICKALNIQVGDLLEYIPEEEEKRARSK